MNTNIEELKLTYQKLAFIHSVLTQKTTYYLEDFEVAKAATIMITDMANKISDDIRSIESAAATESKEVVVNE